MTAPTHTRASSSATLAAFSTWPPVSAGRGSILARSPSVTSVGDTVLYELDGHVATITYNRPEVLNAINGQLRADLNEAFSRFRDDEEAWVGIVTGAGRAFCAGADLEDGEGSVGVFPGTFWEKPTANSFESGWEISNRSSPP